MVLVIGARGGIAGRRQVDRLDACQLRLSLRHQAAAAVAREEDGQDGRDAKEVPD